MKKQLIQQRQYTTQYVSPLGPLLLSSDGENITGLWFTGQKYFGRTLGACPCEQELPVFDEARHWLDLYFSGNEPPRQPPLAAQGSDFQKAVWRILCHVPYGRTTTYRKIAEELEAVTQRRVAAQAVGGAVGHNPISIFIPCHRVVGSNGSLTGYAGGVEKKRWLLELECADTARLFIPDQGTAL